MHVRGEPWAQLGEGGRRHARQDLHRNRQGRSSLWSVWCSGQSAAPQAQVAHPTARCSSSVLGVRALVHTSALAQRRACAQLQCIQYNACIQGAQLHACIANCTRHTRQMVFAGILRRPLQDLHRPSAGSSPGRVQKRWAQRKAPHVEHAQKEIASAAGRRIPHFVYFSCTCLFRVEWCCRCLAGLVAWECRGNIYLHICICMYMCLHIWVYTYSLVNHPLQRRNVCRVR